MNAVKIKNHVGDQGYKNRMQNVKKKIELYYKWMT